MAKKKKRPAKTTTKRNTAAKRKTSPAAKRTTKKKRPAARRSTGNTSVDALLKQFAKDRATKESQLESLRKKKEEIEAKAAKLREQIVKLSDQERAAREELSQLDARRDGEVSQLLSQLGVQLGGTSPSAVRNENQPSKQQDGNSVGDHVAEAFSKRRR